MRLFEITGVASPKSETSTPAPAPSQLPPPPSALFPRTSLSSMVGPAATSTVVEST